MQQGIIGATIGIMIAVIGLKIYDLADFAEAKKIEKIVDRRFKSTDFDYFIHNAKVQDGKICIDDSNITSFYIKENLKPTPFYKMVTDKNSTIVCKEK